jgi:2,3-bisphosphoglycerate-independent phosphoglycerate mutase
VVLCADRFVGRTLRDGSLRDVAPTLLQLLEIPTPSEMTGHSLF